MQVVIWCIWALVIALVVFGVFTLVTGGDPALEPAEPDGVAVPLPGARPLVETDIEQVRFDLALRGYRMAQVDAAMRRAAYDIGYKDELIAVLEAEVAALRAGRTAEADQLASARGAAAAPATRDADDLSDSRDDPIEQASTDRPRPAPVGERIGDLHRFAVDDDDEAAGAEAALEDGFGARSARGSTV
jgi:DivIVA domain-containing protein